MFAASTTDLWLMWSRPVNICCISNDTDLHLFFFLTSFGAQRSKSNWFKKPCFDLIWSSIALPSVTQSPTWFECVRLPLVISGSQQIIISTLSTMKTTNLLLKVNELTCSSRKWKNIYYEQQTSRHKFSLLLMLSGKKVSENKKELGITNWNEQTHSKCTPPLVPAPVQCLKSDYVWMNNWLQDRQAGE